MWIEHGSKSLITRLQSQCKSKRSTSWRLSQDSSRNKRRLWSHHWKESSKPGQLVQGTGNGCFLLISQMLLYVTDQTQKAFLLPLLPRAQQCLWQQPRTQSRYSATRPRSRISHVRYSPWISSCRHRWVRYQLQTSLAGYFIYSQKQSWINSSFKPIVQHNFTVVIKVLVKLLWNLDHTWLYQNMEICRFETIAYLRPLTRRENFVSP